MRIYVLKAHYLASSSVLSSICQPSIQIYIYNHRLSENAIHTMQLSLVRNCVKRKHGKWKYRKCVSESLRSHVAMSKRNEKAWNEENEIYVCNKLQHAKRKSAANLEKKRRRKKESAACWPCCANINGGMLAHEENIMKKMSSLKRQ